VIAAALLPPPLAEQQQQQQQQQQHGLEGRVSNAPGSKAAPAAAVAKKVPNPSVAFNNFLSAQKPPGRPQLEEGQVPGGAYRASYWVADTLLAKAESQHKGLAKNKAALLALAQLQVPYELDTFLDQIQQLPKVPEPYCTAEARSEMMRFWRQVQQAAPQQQGKKQKKQQQQQQQLEVLLQNLPLPAEYGLLNDQERDGLAAQQLLQQEQHQEHQEHQEQQQQRGQVPPSTCPATMLHNHAQRGKLQLQCQSKQGQDNTTCCTWLLGDQPVGSACHSKPKLAKSMAALAALRALQVEYDYESYMAAHNVPAGPVLRFWKQLQGRADADAAVAEGSRKRGREAGAAAGQQQGQGQGSSEPGSPENGRAQQRRRGNAGGGYDWRESMAAAAIAAAAGGGGQQQQQGGGTWPGYPQQQGVQDDKAGSAYLAQLAAALDSDDEEVAAASAGGAGGQPQALAEGAGCASLEASDVEEGELPE
jgi:hypothetical protein